MKTVSFICFSFLVLSFLKQLLVKLQQTNFCVLHDKICLRQNIGFIRDSHACTKQKQIVTSVLVSTTLNKPPSLLFSLKSSPSFGCLFWIFAISCRYPFFRYQSHFNPKQQEQQKNLRTLRTDCQQIERL